MNDTLTTTERLNSNLGSPQYQAINLSMAWAYLLLEWIDRSVLSTAVLDCWNSGMVTVSARHESYHVLQGLVGGAGCAVVEAEDHFTNALREATSHPDGMPGFEQGCDRRVLPVCTDIVIVPTNPNIYSTRRIGTPQYWQRCSITSRNPPATKTRSSEP